MILIKKRQSKLDSRRRFLYYSPLLIFSALGRIWNHNAPVAQLDRVSGYEPEGRAFESLRVHQEYTRPSSSG